MQFLFDFIIVFMLGIIPNIIFEIMGIKDIAEYYKTKNKNKSLKRKISNALNIINLLVDVIPLILILYFYIRK